MHRYLCCYILFGIVFFIVPETMFSQTKDTSVFFNSIDSKWNSWKENTDSSFNKFSAWNTEAFKEFNKRNDEAFKKFRKLIEANWGKGNFAISDNVTWVEYYDQNLSRSIVNFENNTAEIDMLLTPEEASNKEQVLGRTKTLIDELSTTRGKTIDYSTPAEQPAPLSDQPVLEDQLITKNGNPVNSSNLKEFSAEIVKNTKLTRTDVTGNDGVKRIKISLTIPLAPNSIQVRAKKILPIVEKYSLLYNLKPELLLAIIHIESYFNPKAISHSNAIGLMQLVPSSGGLEAYQKVFNKNQKPTRKFLLDPNNNINMGAAYIRILIDRYFYDVHNKESQRYCCIASYNTGPGNLSYAYTRNNNLPNAIEKINERTPKQNYDYLTTHLKYKEAREYLKKVNSRYASYKSWITYNIN